MYLKEFRFPSIEQEDSFLSGILRTCYSGYYPYRVLSEKRLFKLEFEPITILYGDNGSGKSTALNVISEALCLQHESLYNKAAFFDDYVNLCVYEAKYIPENSKIITSDDVFDYMLSLRNVNESIDQKREDLFAEYLELKYDDKYTGYTMNSLKDYEQLKKVNDAKSLSQSEYVRKNLMPNIRIHSNGESAFKYFVEKMEENGLYLLDEPENSLSVPNQQKLFRLISDSARFYNCQFIIATHSPFLVSLKDAKIYDMDSNPVTAKKWTELENMKIYYEFFKLHEESFR